MSQNTINFQHANPLQAMQTLARSIALPHEYAPQRFPSFPALERTAVMGFNSPQNYALPAAESKFILMRQAAYPFWCDRAFTTGQTQVWQYTFETLNSTTAGILGFETLGVGNAAISVPATTADATDTVTLTARPKYVAASGDVTTSFTSGYPLVAVDPTASSAQYYYVPKGCTYSVTYTGGQAIAVAAAGMGAVIEEWLSPSEVREYRLGLANSGTTNFQAFGSLTVTKNTWLRVKGVNVTANLTSMPHGLYLSITAGTQAYTYTAAATSGTITITVNAALTNCLVPMAPPAEFSNSMLPWYASRTTAAAVLLTNTTKVMNKEGSILAGRLNPCVINVWGSTISDITNLHPAEKQMLALESGFYTFCPPSTDLATFWDYTSRSTGDFTSTITSYPVVRLDNDSLVNVFFFSDSDNNTPTTGTQSNFAVNVDWHIEFRCTSALWQIGMSSMTLEAFHQAQLALVAAGFFFPNHTHKEDEMTITSKIGKWAARLAPAASIVHPMAGMALRAGSQLLSNKPRPAPPTTTAAAAGWNGPNKAKGKQKQGKGKKKGKRQN